MLRPLDVAAVRDLVTDTVGHEPGPALLDTAARAGGNPFLVVELVRALDHDGRIVVTDGVAELATAASTAKGVTTEIREVILGRMADLGPESTHLLQVGAALGRSFSVSDVASMLGRPVAALLPLISTVVSAGLLEEDGHELRFRHDLVREAIESTIGRPALAALHLDIAAHARGIGGHRRTGGGALRARRRAGRSHRRRVAAHGGRADREPGPHVGGRVARTGAGAHAGRRSGT